VIKAIPPNPPSQGGLGGIAFITSFPIDNDRSVLPNMNDLRSDDELRQNITQVASRFGLFECDTCAQAIMEFLLTRQIKGKQIKLYTGSAKGKYGNIYHDGLGRNIATNGRHEGIAIEIGGQEIIFDNIHHQGIARETWIANLHCLALDLGGNWEVTEIEF
jgi:Papain fold toxin 2